MLQLSLGYVVQADREREVAEDLRSRQALLAQRDPRSSPSAVISHVVASRAGVGRRSSVRAGSTGA